MFNIYKKYSPGFKKFTKHIGLPGGKCRFSPTCSVYSKTAIKKHGIIKGSFLSTKRVLKCHPLNPGGYDPVPEL